MLKYAISSWKIDEDCAWDIIYKVLHKITEKIASYKFKSEQQFKNMLYTIFNNELKNHYVKTKRIEERLKLISYDEFKLNIGNESENILKESFQDFWIEPEKENPVLKILCDILDKLDEWERILVHMRANGVAYQEIANFIDKPEDQLKVYYSRIKQKIKKLMEEQLNANE